MIMEPTHLFSLQERREQIGKEWERLDRIEGSKTGTKWERLRQSGRAWDREGERGTW